jgi:hypothetical protein
LNNSRYTSLFAIATPGKGKSIIAMTAPFKSKPKVFAFSIA